MKSLAIAPPLVVGAGFFFVAADTSLTSRQPYASVFDATPRTWASFGLPGSAEKPKRSRP